MTFKEIIEEVIKRGFDNVANEEGGEDRIKRWVNQVYREIVDDRPWRFLEATEEGTAPLVIADLGHVLSVSDVTNRMPIEPAERQALVRVDPDLSSTGSAVHWYPEGEEEINVWPLDSVSTFAVRYIMDPPNLAADGDVPVLPAPYHDLLVDGTVAKGYKNTDNYEAAGFARRDFFDGLKGMRRRLKKAYDGHPRTVQRTGSPGDYID